MASSLAAAAPRLYTVLGPVVRTAVCTRGYGRVRRGGRYGRVVRGGWYREGVQGGVQGWLRCTGPTVQAARKACS